MIRSWVGKDAKTLFARQRPKRVPAELLPIGLRKLLMIDAAADIEDLRVPPGNRLEKLKGKRAGQWSIRINDQWRICFEWKDGHAYNVEIVDDH